MSDIIVSICCQTYNHVFYIEECLKGFLMQKTNFKFEILLRDDASIDGTTEIVKEYSNKYPDIINSLIYNENQLKKGVSPFIDNVKRAKGKYIAICEGDDYWIDPYKLQKQVDFLESNIDYGLVFTNYKRLYSGNFKLDNSKTYNGNIFNQLILSNFIGTLTVCFRNELLKKVSYFKIYNQNFKMGDYPLWLAFSCVTKFKFIDDITSIYRISPNTMSNQLNIIDRFNFEESVFDIRYFYLKNNTVNKNIKRKVDNLYLFFLIKNNIRYLNIVNNLKIKSNLLFSFKYIFFIITYFLLRRKASRLILLFPF